MKKHLLILSLIICVTSACKKTETKYTKPVYDVNFVFNPHGNSSDITLKNIQTGEVKTLLSQSSSITITNQVNVGDKFFIEMKGKANGGDDQYNIQILYKNVVIATDRAFGGAVVKDQLLQIDKTFIESDFQNK